MRHSGCGRPNTYVGAAGTTLKWTGRDAVDLLGHGQYAVSGLGGMRTRALSRTTKMSLPLTAGLLLVVWVNLKPIRRVLTSNRKT